MSLFEQLEIERNSVDSTVQQQLRDSCDQTFTEYRSYLTTHRAEVRSAQVGTVISMDEGIARVEGLDRAYSEELLKFPHGIRGLAFNLDENEVGVVLLDHSGKLRAGDEVRRTHRVLDVPVGEELLGRVLDPLGRPLDHLGPLEAAIRLPCDRPSHRIMDRAAVSVPLQTGMKIIDALVPVGRGQRELILGDRQTGKTSVAVNTMLNQTDVICVYCAIGQQTSAVANVIQRLREQQRLQQCVVVVAGGNDPPGAQYVAPYAATSIAEYFMAQGRDVLIVYDDLTTHARAYRQLSLLLRRPPGREAFPGDIFYIHSRLLERSTHLREELGGGSLTALPIAETEAQNLSAYIPTNLISITDGQILLSPQLFQKGVLPAVEVGRSVSRVGGKTQLPVYRGVAGDLKLAYAQFEELEAFSRFSSRLDEETQQRLDRGRLVREVLKQSEDDSLTVAEQVAALMAVTSGAWDALPLGLVQDAEQRLRKRILADHAICQRMLAGERLSADEQEAIRKLAEEAAREVHNAN